MSEQIASPEQTKGVEYQRRHRYAVLTELRGLNEKVDRLLGLVQQQRRPEQRLKETNNANV